MPILVRKNVKVLLAGGGTGGHIYPLLAVADYLRDIGEGSVTFVFMGQVGGFKKEFEDRYVSTYHVVASKIRRYFDLKNLLEGPKSVLSLLQALLWVYVAMPDVVFSKGGPGTLAVVLAARFYRIPVMIHESDAVAGVTNVVSARFAEKVAVTFPNVRGSFPKGKKVVVSGNPIREYLLKDWLVQAGAKQYFKFDSELPVLLVLGGSQGSQRINNFVLDNLGEILGKVQVCHQVGNANLEEVKGVSGVVLKGLGEEVRGRYVVKGYFDEKELKVALNAADIVFSRAGAGSISEIAVFQKPSILIPLKESANDHQRENAYEYAKTGATLVVEEDNLKPHVLLTQMDKMLGSGKVLKAMGEAAGRFARVDAAEVVGKEVLRLVGIDLR